MHRLKKLSAAQKKVEERKLGEKRYAQTLSVCVHGITGDTLIRVYLSDPPKR